MPTPFDQLRDLAAQQRDRAFSAARKEYESALQDIAALEQCLVYRQPVKRPKERRDSLIDLITQCVPQDKPFTLDDLVGHIRQAEPDRGFSKQTIRTNVNRLITQGILKRVRRATGNQRALYAVISLNCDGPRKTLAQWALEVLHIAQRPMTADEIMVAMIDLGFSVPTSQTSKGFNVMICHWVD